MAIDSLCLAPDGRKLSLLFREVSEYLRSQRADEGVDSRLTVPRRRRNRIVCGNQLFIDLSQPFIDGRSVAETDETLRGWFVNWAFGSYGGFDAQEFLQKEGVDGEPNVFCVQMCAPGHRCAQCTVGIVEPIDFAHLVRHLIEGVHRKAAVGICVDEQLFPRRSQSADLGIHQAVSVDRVLAVAVREREPLLHPAVGRKCPGDRG